MNMYKVVCKCGHVGRRNYIKVSFPVVAETRKEAAAKGRMIPRVKHHHKDAILEVVQITKEEFRKLEVKNQNDPYLKCHNIQEQNLIDISDRLISEEKYENCEEHNETKIIFYKKHIVRNPKRFFKNIAMMEKSKKETRLW